MKKISKSKNLIPIMVTFLIIIGVFLPVTQASGVDYGIKGFDKGCSYTSVVPMKKVTFVNFDPETYIDDYAYLAAVPTSVFNYDSKLFSNPLLFYQDEYPVKEDKERSLNARQGLDYFMEDWMSYCNGKLDQMTLVNVPKNRIPSEWDTRNCILVSDDNPFDVASKLALREWSYSDKAVVAVIKENFEKNNKNSVKGSIKDTLPAYKIGNEEFEMDKPSIGIGGTYQSFEVSDTKYKYLVAQATWDNPSFDIDMQIYDNKLGMVSSNAESSWKKGVAEEIGGSFIHDYGTWKIGLTAFPKKSKTEIYGKMENLFQISSKNSLGLLSKMKKDKANIKILLYPGVKIEIEDLPSFGCRDAKFVLKWDDPNVHLGLTVVDPFGTEIASSYTKDEIINKEFRENENRETVNVSMLGECEAGEKYSVYVYTLDDLLRPIDFTLEYSWNQKYPKEEGDSFTSAANGAVLASLLNAPLLYTSPSSLSPATKDVLYKLGVKKIYIVDIGNLFSINAKNEIKTIGETIYYQQPEEIYKCVRNISNSYDIVFTTIEPWMQWYVSELKPSEKIKDGALFIGPASYIAAHHGCPVFIVDEHPELSKAVVYHKDFWIKNAQFRTEPSAGDMILSGREVYKFLDKLGFDKKANTDEEAMETIITVAGQFNIGPTWDRTFVGKALSGRFHFSPVDTSYWIARNVFYPALIFENPALHGKIKLINGSKSKISHLPGARLKKPFGVNLVITKPSQEEEFNYPVLQTYVSAAYKFNEQASKHWGTMYTRADGITPYVTPSPDSIDVGATDKSGAYYPDLSDTEVIPFYCGKAGYDSVFSTNFDKVVENLNRGVIMWIQDAHGFHNDGGLITFWNPESPYVYEENPWRAYEPIMLKPGHLGTFIHWIAFMASEYLGVEGLDKIAKIKILPMQLFSEVGCTENPDVSLFNPNLAGVSRIVNKLSGGLLDVLGAFGFMIHWDRLLNNPDHLPILTTYDGMITTSATSGSGLIERSVTGPEFDDALKNLHSAGVNTVVCLPAGTYLQMTWIRHGATYTIMDPWSTSDYCAVWLQSIIKDLALGDTIGQAYEKGIRACGPEYLVNHWWWDTLENVCFYGDPNLRIFVPSTVYSDSNYWEQKETLPLVYDEKLDINGHTPFGAADYPHEKQPQSSILIWMIVGIVVILLVVIAVVVIIRGKKAE